ncbi:VOC family protein [Mucilaginibacter celer]|uniref:VOC family protein n=1 Tax=Mucilaginibacter celer TaxID=2305508 RepID=A0A494VM69_9SPHI|nr:VOC family protein [Mucilaginibacter celer]AYL96387.1 VOC family protein [Mucilaginibacter celer]
MMTATLKLNHINLTVTDVAASAHFFEQHFGFKIAEVKGENMLAILEGTGGFVLVLMADTSNRKGNNTYPEMFHIGFLVDTADEVNKIYEGLKKAGLATERAPGNLRGGFGFYFNAPGGILTEVTCLTQN